MENEELYNVSKDWAENVYHKLIMSLDGNEDILLNNDELEIFNNLLNIDWFKRYNTDDEATEVITRDLLTFLKYSKLVDKKKNEPPGWQFVKAELQKIKKGLCDDR